MRTYKYTGTFIGDNNHKYTLSVHCNGFLQAFILLTADAIRGGRHYQLNRIQHEDGAVRLINDINEIGNIIN